MRAWLRALPWFAASAGAAAAVLALGSPIDLGAWWAGEIDWTGRRQFEPPAPDAAKLAQVDFSLVHGELWPAYVAAAPGQEDAAFGRLREAVAPDPYLALRVDRMRRLASDPAENAERLLYQVWAWNRYLDMAGVPWRLTAGVQVLGPHEARFYVKSYRVLSDTPTRVGEAGYWRTRVVQRVDDLSVVEGYLGLTSDHESGAVVVAERVAAFAIERVWPLLDPELDVERLAIDARFAPAIRSAVREALHPTDYLVLEETAADRFWLERAVAQVHLRARCGSRFQIGYLPFDGLHHRDLLEVRRYAAATADSPCPDVTQIEALALTVRSKKLQTTSGLRQALEALGAWVARSIAVHEARHAADDAEPGVLGCDGCPDDFGTVARLEVSAYVSSFADEEVGVVSALQACAVEQVDAAGRGKWIRFVSDRLGGVCDQGPPEDLATRGRALERQLFHREEPIALHPDFPVHLPLERAVRAGLPAASDGEAEHGPPTGQ